MQNFLGILVNLVRAAYRTLKICMKYRVSHYKRDFANFVNDYRPGLPNWEF